MKIKTPIIILLLTMVVGFASVTANYIASGKARIGINENDFKVVFRNATAQNGDVTISEDGTTIIFETDTLTNESDSSVLNYTVANTSINYDADIIFKITDSEGNSIESDLFTIVETKKIPSRISSLDFADGQLTITLNKSPLNNLFYDFNIIIDATAVEKRNSDINIDTSTGLYDSNGNITTSWDVLVGKYGFDISGDNNSLSGIINDNPELGGFTELVIPEGVTTIARHSLNDVDQLKKVSIPSTVEKLDEAMFDGDPNLEEIIVSDDNPNYSSLDGILFDKNQKELICYPAGKKDDMYRVPDGVEKIGKYSFEDTTLSYVIFPESVSIIDYNVFSESSVENVDVEGFGYWLDEDKDYKYVGTDFFENSEENAIFLHDSDDAYIKKTVAGLYTYDYELLISYDELVSKYGYDMSENDSHNKLSDFLPNDILEEAEVFIMPSSEKIIGEYAFGSDLNFTTIILPISLQIIGISGFGGMNTLNKVYFAYTDNWHYQNRNNNISEEDLKDPTKAATIVVKTYAGYEIFRS